MSNITAYHLIFSFPKYQKWGLILKNPWTYVLNTSHTIVVTDALKKGISIFYECV